MIPLYAGFDDREEVGFHTFTSSVIHRASLPTQIIPLHLPMLKGYTAGARDGTNAFIYSRFLIPWLQGYRGHAIFMDGADMVMNADIADLWKLKDVFKAVQVVKHDYQTKHPRKYVGTRMEAENSSYRCKNWSSVMLINCAHYSWRQITPETVGKMSGSDLHSFSFIQDRFVGDLPKEWNWLADEYGENNEAKVIHYTAGIPGFPHYKDTPMASRWFRANKQITYAID